MILKGSRSERGVNIRRRFAIFPRRVWTRVYLKRYDGENGKVFINESDKATKVWIWFSPYLAVWRVGDRWIGKASLLVTDPGIQEYVGHGRYKRTLPERTFGFKDLHAKACEVKVPFVSLGRGVPTVEE